MQGWLSFCFCFNRWSVLVWWFPHCCGIFVGSDGFFGLITNWALRGSLPKKTDSFWSFLFESLEIPNLLIWILSSTRKDSKVFINSIWKLVSLTCSFRSAKLDVLVCVTLFFCMGLRKCFFFQLYISLRNHFFSPCGQKLQPWFSLAQSKWRRIFLLFQHLQSLREPPVSFFCCEFEPWEQELRIISTTVTEFRFKNLGYRYCACILIKI